MMQPHSQGLFPSFGGGAIDGGYFVLKIKEWPPLLKTVSLDNASQEFSLA